MPGIRAHFTTTHLLVLARAWVENTPRQGVTFLLESALVRWRLEPLTPGETCVAGAGAVGFISGENEKTYVELVNSLESKGCLSVSRGEGCSYRPVWRIHSRAENTAVVGFVPEVWGVHRTT